MSSVYFLTPRATTDLSTFNVHVLHLFSVVYTVHVLHQTAAFLLTAHLRCIITYVKWVMFLTLHACLSVCLYDNSKSWQISMTFFGRVGLENWLRFWWWSGSRCGSFLIIQRNFWHFRIWRIVRMYCKDFARSECFLLPLCNLFLFQEPTMYHFIFSITELNEYCDVCQNFALFVP